MKRSGWSRSRGHLAFGVVLLLAAGLAPAAAAGPAQVSALTSSATQVSGFSTARGSVRVGGQLQSAVTVSPAGVRTVTVQYRRAGATRFSNAATHTTSSLGHVTVTLKPPAAGTWQFRLVVAASAHARGAVTALRTVVASGRAAATTISGYASSPATVGVGASLRDDVVIVPRSARVIQVQARRPGSTAFTTQSTGRASASGAFRAVYRPSIPGTWRYRLVVPATAIALQGVSAIRTVAAKDITAPAPVTALHATAAKTTSVTLSWTNPNTADFTGVTIRRAAGPTAPSSPGAGTLVATTAKGSTTVTDDGLAATSTYSYALFAHDGVPNYAPAAQLTVTTDAVLTAAVSITDYASGPPTSRLTTNSIATFDLSGSHAGPGRSLSTATLDFGDGTPVKNLTGNPSTWQVEHAYSDAGTKTATVTITDSAGTTVTNTQQVAVSGPPSLAVTQTGGAAVVNQPVTFTVTSSTPAGSAFTDYDLSYNNEATTAYGDGSPPSVLTHTFAAAGTYTVIVDAYNDADGARRSTIKVVVTDPTAAQHP